MAVSGYIHIVATLVMSLCVIPVAGCDKDFEPPGRRHPRFGAAWAAPDDTNPVTRPFVDVLLRVAGCNAGNVELCQQPYIDAEFSAAWRAGGDVAADYFMKSCGAGHGPACHELANRVGRSGVGILDASWLRDLLRRLCLEGELTQCIQWGDSIVAFDPDALKRVAVESLFDVACRLGDGGGCFWGASYLTHVTDGISTSVRIKGYTARSCELGYSLGCEVLSLWDRRPEYSRLCEQGRASSCSDMGNMLKMGWGGGIDLAKARGYYQKACEYGRSEDCYTFASYCLNGEGGPIDFELARSSYGRACDLSYAFGCVATSEMMIEGRGGPRELQGAARILGKWCEAGIQDACALGCWLGSGIEAPSARQVYGKACRPGEGTKASDDGCLRLGLTKLLVDGDSGSAFEDFDRACSIRSDDDACIWMAALAMSKNPRWAKSYFEPNQVEFVKSCADDPDSCLALSYWYRVNGDQAAAEEFLARARTVYKEDCDAGVKGPCSILKYL